MFYIAWRVRIIKRKYIHLALYSLSWKYSGLHCVLHPATTCIHILHIEIRKKTMRPFKQHSPFIPLKTALYCCVYTLVKQQMHMSLMMFWNAYRRISNLPNIAHNHFCKTLYTAFYHAFEILKITTKMIKSFEEWAVGISKDTKITSITGTIQYLQNDVYQLVILVG